MTQVRIIEGDASTVLRTLPDQSVNCCITSPPYWQQRDYGVDGQLGLEQTPELYVANLVDALGEVRRVIRNDGTLWLNLGDKMVNKRLLGLPWRVALALQADGWILRSDVIWHKQNPLPERVTDRPTRSHEYLFLLTRSARYYYDSRLIQEPSLPGGGTGRGTPDKACRAGLTNNGTGPTTLRAPRKQRNRRSVWTLSSTPYPGTHFAVMPQTLVEPCLLAGCPEGGVVLDPFSGSGTVGVVALRHNRNAILIDLSPASCEEARARLERQAAR